MRTHVNNILAHTYRDQYQYSFGEFGSLIDEPSYEYSLRMRNILCKEEQSSGFMLDSRSDHWPIRCLWTGNDANATCAPAPPHNSSIFHIAPSSWRRQVRVCFSLRTVITSSDVVKIFSKGRRILTNFEEEDL